MTTPTLSLCMIVKNEAAALAPCLLHAAGLWDELCVVDTGSQDETCHILRRARANIISHTWNDDFAAARNAGLPHATGDWVLVLDADELASPSFIRSARELMKDPQVGAATVALHHTLPNGHTDSRKVVTHAVRMWRNDANIRFEGVIHEDVVLSVDDYLQRSGTRLGAVDGSIEHRGYAPCGGTHAFKKARDIRLLRASIERNPDDVRAGYKLLRLARFWQDRALLEAHAPDVLLSVSHTAAQSLAAMPFLGDLMTLLAEGLHPNDPARAQAFLAPWEATLAHHAAYCLRRGELFMQQGDAPRAIAAFHHCLSLRHDVRNFDFPAPRPLLGLARLAWMRGDVAEALSYAHAALEKSPRDPDALLALLTLCRHVGGDAAVTQVTNAYVRSYGDNADLREAVQHAWPT